MGTGHAPPLSIWARAGLTQRPQKVRLAEESGVFLGPSRNEGTMEGRKPFRLHVAEGRFPAHLRQTDHVCIRAVRFGCREGRSD